MRNNNGPAVLYHFSEDPSIKRFEPQVAPTSARREPLVWAVDAEHAHLYFFPRDCPRVHFCAGPQTSREDIDRFMPFSTAKHVAAIEAGWLERMRSTEVYRYDLRPDGFALEDEVAGYWVKREAVEPLRVEPLGDLLAANASACVELRIMPSLRALRDAVIASTLEFSVIRWRNAAPPPSDSESRLAISKGAL